MPVLCKGYSHGDLSLELEGNSNFLVSFPQEKLSSGKVKWLTQVSTAYLKSLWLGLEIPFCENANTSFFKK